MRISFTRRQRHLGAAARSVGCRLATAALFVSAPLILVTHASEESSGCPASAEECLKYFADLAEKRGWVGVELMRNQTTSGWTVMRVVEDSPAEAAGLAVGDVLKELNGFPFEEEPSEGFLAEREKMIPGATIVYTISRNGERVKIPVELGRLPASVIYSWTGQHMLEEHVEQASD